jgi:hypothetical protein
LGVEHGANNPILEKFHVTELRDNYSRTELMERHRHGKGTRKGKNDIFIATWNVRTLNKPGAPQNLEEKMDKYRIAVAAIRRRSGTEVESYRVEGTS